ncbi:hypothetical protein L210DRAFT_2728968 [Boletus edulis BED1]|uniref:Uncharacterized protein n=1 Tax=Boletus edulis BED1 TaxID=1328754 RepID=A0AAD4G652_BOLED|nr:hypothetical protein L210DRAFT_2728968 [Boletus edulis BED1]
MDQAVGKLVIFLAECGNVTWRSFNNIIRSCSIPILQSLRFTLAPHGTFDIIGENAKQIFG